MIDLTVFFLRVFMSTVHGKRYCIFVLILFEILSTQELVPYS